jgi:Family of unknown function (DUF6247)
VDYRDTVTATYGVGVTASAAAQPDPPKPPFADASPAEVRAALIPEEAAEFDLRWRAVLAEAAETFDLTNIFKTLDHWRQIAWMTTSHGPEAHRRMLAKAAEILRTGELPPGTVPWSQVKAELGL